jgi:hypothetical protein
MREDLVDGQIIGDDIQGSSGQFGGGTGVGKGFNRGRQRSCECLYKNGSRHIFLYLNQGYCQHSALKL